jgi:hypothetical protein
MRVERTGPLAFTIEFESEDELRAEYASNLSAKGLRLGTAEKVANFATLTLTLRLGARAAETRASVVGALPGALALAVEGEPDALLATLTAPPAAAEGAEEGAKGTAWDRVRALSPVERRMLAPKAERGERLVLAQDSDPQVLFYLLKNPRIGVEEVVALAKSSGLSFQAAELIVKTPHWVSNMEVKVALVHNPRTPPQMALRILPTLTKGEIAKIAKGAAVNQALKSAALKLTISS